MPGVGKTTLLERLSSDLGIGYITKDSIKELLGDTLYTVGEPTSPHFYGVASVEALFTIVEAFVSSDKTIFVENAFWNDLATARINRVIADKDVDLLQVYISCDYDETRRRFQRRREKGVRHKIHQDNTYSHRDFEENKQKYRQLDIRDMKTYCVDTTKFEETDYQKLSAWLKLEAGGI